MIFESGPGPATLKLEWLARSDMLYGNTVLVLIAGTLQHTRILGQGFHVLLREIDCSLLVNL